MKAYVQFLLMINLGGCAFNPDVKREMPGIKGQLHNQGMPVQNAKITYSKGISNSCSAQNSETTTTKEDGSFKIHTSRQLQIIELLPDETCQYSGTICIESNTQRAWQFTIEGKGEVEYHTGGNVRREPSRLLLMTPEGRCSPPKWLTLNCDFSREDTDLCQIN